MIKILFAAILILISTPLYAAVYYVDYTNSEGTSADTNDGLSTGAACLHCPGDNDMPAADADADCDDITLAAGDTVVFKGGVVYAFDEAGNNYIEATTSGTNGNPITYISGHVYVTPWGTGRAKIDGSNATPQAASKNGVLYLSNKAYITVQGLELYYNEEAPSDTTGMIGWDDQNSSTDAQLIIDNVYVHDVGGTGIIIQGRYTATGKASNVTIKNSDFSTSYYHLIHIRYGMSDVLIENNTFDDAGGDYYDADGYTEPRGNPIGLTGAGDSNGQLDITVRGNDFDDSVPSGNKGLMLIQIDQGLTNLIIEDNYFHGTITTGTINISAALTDAIIRNNLFHVNVTTHQGVLRFNHVLASFSGSGNGIDILNNTFVCTPEEGIIWFYENSDDDIQYQNVKIQNNIIDTDGSTDTYLITIYKTDEGAPKDVVEMSSLTIDHNAYQSLNSTSDYFWVEDEGPGMTFAEWKTYIAGEGASGNDANSNFGQVTFTNENGDVFTIDSTDTVALDEGTDLTAEGYTDDKDGVTRPQNALWDIGAYEYEIAESCAVTGITPSATETEIVTGGKTIILTLTNDTWTSDVGNDHQDTEDLLDGLDSNKVEATGWNAEVRDALADLADNGTDEVTRDSTTQVSILLPALASYDITESETITVTIPTTAVSSATEIVCTPTFQIGTVTPPGPLYPEIGLMGGTCSGCSM